MSNITVREIFDISASAFGVTIDDMAKHYRGNRRGSIPNAMAARGVAIILATRHTEASYPEVARTIGWHNRMAGVRFAELGARVEKLLTTDWVARLCSEIVEDEIDRIHEARMAAIERLERTGFAGLIAQTSKKPPRESQAAKSSRRLPTQRPASKSPRKPRPDSGKQHSNCQDGI